MTQSFLVFKKNENIFGIRNIRIDLSNGRFDIKAETSGDIEFAEPFLAELSEICRKFFETQFDEYGVIHLDQKGDGVIGL